MQNRYRKLLSYYRPYLRTFVFTMLCAFLSAGLALVMPLCVRYITKNILEAGLPDAWNAVLRMGGVMLGVALAQTLCSYIFDYYGHAMGARMEGDMRQNLFGHYQKLSFRFFDKHKTGQLMSRITNDIYNLAELFHHGPEDYIVYLVKLIGSFVILFSINARLTAVIFLFLPIMAFYMVYFNKRVNKGVRQNRAIIGDINSHLEDNLSGIRVVKSFANEDLETDKFASENTRFFQSRCKVYKLEALYYEGMMLFNHLVLIVVVVAGGLLIPDKSLDLADLLTFLLYINSVLEPIRGLGRVTIQFQDGITGFHRFMDMMETEPDIADKPGAVELTEVRGDIRFDNVEFRYREGSGNVLAGISLDVKAGEYIALVGTSGAGKTTLCSLIPRFYEVSGGAVLIDGVNVKNIKTKSLRQNIGLVQQDVFLFAGTVMENILYGKPGATREMVIEAAKKANAHEFISALPNGYDTDIGQRGVKLSGGQKQRLSIARVLLKNPPILIFDEATSSLDNESERVIQEALELLACDRTVFVIAHRLSTVRNAQRILVLTENGVAEEGSHDELLARSGVYAKLYDMQFAR